VVVFEGCVDQRLRRGVEGIVWRRGQGVVAGNDCAVEADLGGGVCKVAAARLAGP
jgi:hypothetical protein